MRDPLLVTMRGPNDLDVRSLSNFEAGIAFLTLMDSFSPGITFGELAAAIDGEDSGRMAGFWSSIKKAATSVKNGIGGVLRDTGNYIGDKAGSAVRLVTDEKVIDGAGRIGSAYATGGGSEGVRGLLESLGGGKGEGSNTEKILGFISSLGSAFKGQAEGDVQTAGFAIPKTALPWMVAGGGALLLIGLTRGGGRRR